MHKEYLKRVFNIKNLGDSLDLYVQSDTLLLADVFENFGNTYNTYELDPASFLSAPGLAWQAALNKYMKKYDKNKVSSYLMYFDANNLYGCSVSQKLPVDGFKWKKIC